MKSRFVRHDINPITCVMARKACPWSKADLAEAAGVGLSTITRFETVAIDLRRSLCARKLQDALEKMGIEFVDDRTVRVPAAWVEELQEEGI